MELYLFLALIASLALNGFVIHMHFKQTRERDIRHTAQTLPEAEHFIHQDERKKEAEKIKKEREKALKKMTPEELEHERRAQEF